MIRTDNNQAGHVGLTRHTQLNPCSFVRNQLNIFDTFLRPQCPRNRLAHGKTPMDNAELFERLNNTGTMPTPSRVALELLRLARDHSSSRQAIVEVVETDPPLCSKLLQYANSALVSPVSHIASIPKAVIQLGIQTIVNLALGFSLLSHNKNGVCRGFAYQAFWSNALARAIASRSVGEYAADLEPEELFVCGLLANIGSLALAAQFPEEYSLIFSEKLDRATLLLREKEQFGIDHLELSGALFKNWGLSNHYADAVSLNDDAALHMLDDTTLNIRRVLTLAGLITEICLLEMPLQDKITRAEQQAQSFGLEEAEFADIFNNIVENWQRWGHIFQIPTKKCPLFQQIKELQDEQPRQPESASGDHIKILLVDDDPITILNLSRLLQNKGNEVYTADNGEDALRIAIEHEPHLVITDWHMPKISGIELCRILRHTSITQHIYIIMLTGKESDEGMVEALQSGADDFINKPFTPSVLTARIASGERIIRYQQMINRDREVIQKYAARLASANRKLQTMAMTDTLTGLPNRRSALARLKDVVAEAGRHHEPLSCIMIDIDHFKYINDHHGHDIGDSALKKISELFSSNARSYDMVSRIGGEEFLVICARSAREASIQLAERLRVAVEKMQIIEDNVVITTTISLGVGVWHESMRDGEAMVKAADRALYKAKQLGRNRVEVEDSFD